MSSILDDNFPLVWLAIHAWTGTTPGPEALRAADKVSAEIKKLIEEAEKRGYDRGRSDSLEGGV